MLLKGCYKRMICLHSTNSRLFCEAFFVLREDAPSMREQDMLAEATRILEERLLPGRRRKRRLLSALLPFLYGALAASLVWFICLMIVIL